MLGVRDIMTTDVVTLPEHTPLRGLGELLRARGASGAVVVRDGSAVGVVPETFFVGATHATSVDASENRDARRTVGEVVKRTMWTVSPDASLYDAASCLARAGTRRLLVASGGHLLGIVTLSDLAKAVAAQPRAEPAPAMMPGR